MLYLQPVRTPGLLSAQAEYQARILPALADQLQAETSAARHPRGPAPASTAVEQAMTDATLRQALAFATRGWPVLPCLPGQKIPATAHGYRDATTDPGQITEWFGRHPDWNLAIATGAPGPDVLDVDDHGPAGNGYPAFRRLRDAGLLDGAAIYVRTPSGGLHAYFTGSHQRNGHLPGHHLDFRSAGGYVLTPPSQIDGQPYQLIEPARRPRPAWTGPPSPASCNPSASTASAARQPQAAGRDLSRPGPLGRRPARRQPQRRPVLGRQPRPGNRPRRRPEPARRRRPPGRPARRRDHPDPELRPPHQPTRQPDHQAEVI